MNDAERKAYLAGASDMRNVIIIWLRNQNDWAPQYPTVTAGFIDELTYTPEQLLGKKEEGESANDR